MLNKLKNNKGFTIIEVMIVLAIAGLIILVVLLAVPALQRNSRNTAMKNDASAVASAVTEYESNNDGALPKVATQSGSSVDLCDAATCTTTKSTAKVQANTQVNYEAAATPTTSKYDVGNIDLDFGYKCTGSGAVVTASNRSVAILYSIETSGTASPKCLDT